MSVKRHLILNGAATVFQQIVLAGRQLIVVPFFIYAWGVETYGEWLTLSAVPMALALCDLGLGTAAANSFVHFHAQGKIESAARAMRTGLALVGLATIFGALLACLLLAALLQSDALAQLSVSKESAVAVVTILLFARLAGLARPLNTAWFRAARQAHIATQLTTYFELVRTASTVMMLSAGMGMISISICDLAVSILSVTFMHKKGQCLLPEVRPGQAQIRRREVREYFVKGLAFMMSPIRWAISNQGTLLVTRVLLGPEAVALVSTLRTIINSLSQLYGSINATIFPELQRAIATEQMDMARRVYRLGLATSVASSSVGCIFLLTVGPPIYSHWTSGKLTPPPHAWLILIVSIFIHAFWRTAGATFAAANRPEPYAIAGIVAASLGVISSALLAGPLDIAGIFAGILIMEVTMAAYVVPTSCAMIHQSILTLPSSVFEERHELYKYLHRIRST